MQKPRRLALVLDTNELAVLSNALRRHDDALNDWLSENSIDSDEKRRVLGERQILTTLKLQFDRFCNRRFPNTDGDDSIEIG